MDIPKHPSPPRRPAEPCPERRRAGRWNGCVPVFVYGYAGDLAPFHEEAYSKVVGGLGALLIMTTAVPVGGRLLLINKATQIEQECQVVRLGRRDGLSIEVAVQFSVPNQEFWRLIARRRDPAPVLIDTRRRTR